MFETLKHIDQQFFLAVNNGLQNSVLDFLCPIIRRPQSWYAVYVIIIYFIYKNYKKQAIWVILTAFVLVLVSDQLSANLIKNVVQRLRPCNDPLLQTQVHLLVNCGSGFSFVSAHACNHFAIALFISGLFKAQGRWILPLALCWASLIAFSQVYVGVHYPFDVICGAILGSGLGFGFSGILIKLLKN